MGNDEKMTKQYIRIPGFIDRELRKLQGNLIHDLLIDVSYSTVVNALLMSGLLAADKLDKDQWRLLRDFIYDQERVPAIADRNEMMLAKLTTVGTSQEKD